MNSVGICVVGAGRAGLVHARNYRQNVPGALLTAIVDADLDVAKRAARELEMDLYFSSLHDALESASFEAVCIASPTFTHRDLAVAAAEEGKHIFCEKPMALTLEEAGEMIEGARAARVVLQMGFMRRFDPVFHTARERLEVGEIGTPMLIRSLTRGPGLPPRWACDIGTSNGMLAEVNSHDFDTIRWLGESEFERIYAEANTLKCFDPVFHTARERLEAGEIGTPMLIRSLTRGPGLPPRWACDIETSNGMLAEVNSHDFDTIRWLGESEFERIYAEANTLKCFDLKEEFPDFYDNAIVSLRLRNGTLGVIDGSCPVHYGYDARAEVLGSEGVMLIGELQDTAVFSCTKNTGLVVSNFPGWRERFREAYVAEARHFVECIVKEQEPIVTGEDGKRALEGVLAANQSIRTGSPVYLPFEGG